jgi:hypothetical protein
MEDSADRVLRRDANVVIGLDLRRIEIPKAMQVENQLPT